MNEHFVQAQSPSGPPPTLGGWIHSLHPGSRASSSNLKPTALVPVLQWPSVETNVWREQIDQDSVKQKPMELLPQPALPPPIPVNEVMIPQGKRHLVLTMRLISRMPISTRGLLNMGRGISCVEVAEKWRSRLKRMGARQEHFFSPHYPLPAHPFSGKPS